MEEKNQVPFSGTLAQELQLKEVIAAHKEQPGCLMPVLQQAQEIYGYLPIEVQAIVAEGLGISLSEALTAPRHLYSQFRLDPKGIYRISICLGTACYVKGAAKVLEAAGAKVGHPGRPMHAGWAVLPGELPLRRRLRSGPGHDDQR